MHRIARFGSQPLRQIGLPVLRGPGIGLRVSVGQSSLRRVFGGVEIATQRRLVSLLRPGDVMWDVGANVGWFSLLAARCVGRHGRVVAFEPVPDNVRHLKANAARNRLELCVVAAAVSDESGWASFDMTSSLGAQLLVDGTKRVPVVTLDDCASELGPPSLIKLDIEGAEVAALRAARGVLERDRPVVICECHGTNARVQALLEAAEYRVESIETPWLTPADAPWWVHVVGSPL